MSLSLQELRRLYAFCDPDEPLEPGDPRYVDIDRADEAGGRPRRYGWIQRISRKFELGADSPRTVLLTGLPGSGKSTELRLILDQLRDPEGAALFPVLIDAEQVIDLRAPLDLPELVLTLLMETERRIIVDLEEADPAGADNAIATKSVGTRFWNWLATTEVELSSFDIGVFGQKLTLELKTNEDFKDLLRKVVKQRLGSFLLRAREHMEELQARVKCCRIDASTSHYAGLVIALDSLERLRGTSSNASDVLDSVEYIFRNFSARDLGAHAIFTVPAALVTRSKLDVEFMPAIKIRARDGADYEPGLLAMHALLDGRMSADEQTAVFGPEHESRVRTMIVQSGGDPREFLKMVQEALSVAELPLDARAFRVLMGTRADGYRRLVRGDALDLLRKIHRDKPPLSLHTSEPGNSRLTDSLLMNSLVMLYQNDTEWTDVNPAILSMIAERDDGL